MAEHGGRALLPMRGSRSQAWPGPGRKPGHGAVLFSAQIEVSMADAAPVLAKPVTPDGDPANLSVSFEREKTRDQAAI